MYEFAGAAVLRVTTCPSGLGLPPWPDLGGGAGEHLAGWARWLELTWALPGFADAVENASPVLARSVRQACADGWAGERQARSQVMSVMRYLLRWTSRATPFGLFAGIAPARFGPAAAASFEDGHHVTLRPDGAWLAGLIAGLESCPQLRSQSLVRANELVVARDDRLVLGCRPGSGHARQDDLAEVSIRRTQPVQAIMAAAHAAARVRDLVSAVGSEFPEAPAALIDRTVAEMAAQGFLVTSIRPPMTATNPLGYLAGELARLGPGSITAEVELDDHAIAGLAAWQTTVGSPAPHAEVCASVYAASLAAIDRGEFGLAVSGVSRSAGAMTGRFLHLLAPGERERIVTALRRLPVTCANALPVQVSCPPSRPGTENVARVPAVLPHLLRIAECHAGGEDVITVDDLAVSADADRFYLVSVSRRCPVEPVPLNAVELAGHVHPLVRFLCEIATARSAACLPFSWGAARRLPFLPRIRYRRSILSPAQWTLTAADLPGPGAAWPQWTRELVSWRHRYQVTDAIYLGGGDRRIRLDLDEPSHLYLLRAELDRAGRVTVREAPDAAAFGWIGGRAHELVVSIASTCPPVPARTWRGPVLRRDHGQLPATGDLLYAKLYAHPDQQTVLLTRYLRELFASWEPAPLWWFLRYNDPDPHLRLRVRLRDPCDFAEASAAVGAWTQRVRDLGLAGRMQLDTYYPETGRFGDGPAMAAAEAVFAADSAAVITQLQAAGRPGSPHPQALAAAGMLDLAAGLCGSARAARSWLISRDAGKPVAAPGRQIRHQAVQLANPGAGQPGLNAVPGGSETRAAWQHRRAALAAYRAEIASPGSPAFGSVMASLLHLHHVRLAGPSPDGERACLHLARAAALSWTRRPAGHDQP
jgi:thiopeptide-type bacteriocin biosynthesis protein